MSFGAVFQEVFNLCIVKELSFTKEDVENLAPFERRGYIQMVQNFYDEMDAQRKEEEQRMKAEANRKKA